MLVGSRQEALVRHINQLGIELSHGLLSKAQTLHHAALEVLAENIGCRHQILRDLAPARILDVKCQAFFVAIEGREKSGSRTQQAARAVALNGLDLDDLGPQIGKNHAAGRSHDHVGEFDHSNAGERQARYRRGMGRQGRGVHRVASFLAVRRPILVDCKHRASPPRRYTLKIGPAWRQRICLATCPSSPNVFRRPDMLTLCGF